jgi:hypothetical protein
LFAGILQFWTWVQNRRAMKRFDREHIKREGVKNLPNDGSKSRRFPF